jgi:hypothetical protein
MICPSCKNEFERVNRNQKFCCPKCCTKYHSTRDLKQKRITALRYWHKKHKNAFPKWKCKCGNEIQLDFHPLKEPNKLKNIICDKCIQKDLL